MIAFTEGTQKGSFTACGSLCGLDEGLSEPAIALARFSTQALASADLGGWAQSCPGN
jgi:hypothetical protein